MSDLSGFTIAQLQEEIDKRKMAKPKPRDNPDFTNLKIMCMDFINDMDSGFFDKDKEGKIFEEAMEAVFGKDVWFWYNEQMEKIPGAG